MGHQPVRGSCRQLHRGHRRLSTAFRPHRTEQTSPASGPGFFLTVRAGSFGALPGSDEPFAAALGAPGCLETETAVTAAGLRVSQGVPALDHLARPLADLTGRAPLPATPVTPPLDRGLFVGCRSVLPHIAVSSETLFRPCCRACPHDNTGRGKSHLFAPRAAGPVKNRQRKNRICDPLMTGAALGIM